MRMSQSASLKRLLLAHAAAAAVLAGSGGAMAQNPELWGAYADFYGRLSDGNGSSAAQPSLFLPLASTDRSLAFGNVFGTFVEGGASIGSLGVGYRTIVADDVVIGGNLFVDHIDHDFGQIWQLGLGAEVLAERWEARVNAYIPEGYTTAETVAGGIGGPAPVSCAIGDLCIVDNAIGVYNGGGGGTSQLFRRALPGVDGEVGYRHPFDGGDVRVFGGGYYYDAAGYSAESGFRSRVEVNLYDPLGIGWGGDLTIGAMADIGDDTTVAGTARFRIPLQGYGDGAPAGSFVDRRMIQPIERWSQPVVAERQESTGGGVVELVPVIDPRTGEQVNSIWFADGDGGGDGTEGNATDLDTAIMNAGANSMVVLYGDGGDFTGSDINTPANMILLGGGSTFDFGGTGDFVGDTFTYDPANSRPTIVHSGAGIDTLVSGAQNSVIGISFDANGPSDLAGIYLDGSNSTLIRDTDFTDYRYGIFSVSSEDLVIENITIDTDFSAGRGIGIYLFGSHRTNIENYDYTGPGSSVTNGEGILAQSTQNLTIGNATISGIAYGIAVSSNSTGLTLDNAEIDDTRFNGIRITSGSNGAALSNVTLGSSTATGSGIDVNNATGVTLTGSNSVNSISEGISVSNGGSLDAENVTINVITTGATVTGSGSMMDLENVAITVSNDATNGINASNGTTLILNNSAITGPGAGGTSDGLQLGSATLSGSGNTISSFNQLCNVLGAPTGSITFNGASTCP